MTLKSDIQTLSPSARITVFELDATILGDSGVHRFCNHKNEKSLDLVWNTQTYYAWPIEADGFEYSSRGTLPTPKVRVGNIGGVISVLCRQYGNLIGAKVTRIRTLSKYLDAVNFITGNGDADPTAELPRDVYFINRKVLETKSIVEFELATAFDVAGIMLPRRQIIQNLCTSQYRSTECSYSGGAVADENDTPTANILLDKCGKRLSSCVMRFPGNVELPYGGFPGAGLNT